jgi:hypothetical protein
MKIVLWEFCKYINDVSSYHSSQFRLGVAVTFIAGCHVVNFHCTSKEPWQNLHFIKYAEFLGPALSFKCSNSTEYVASSSNAMTVAGVAEDSLENEGVRLGCGLRRPVNNLSVGVAPSAHVQHHTCRGEEIKDGRRGLIIRKMFSSAMLKSIDKAQRVRG